MEPTVLPESGRGCETEGSRVTSRFWSWHWDGEDEVGSEVCFQRPAGGGLATGVQQSAGLQGSCGSSLSGHCSDLAGSPCRDLVGLGRERHS